TASMCWKRAGWSSPAAMPNCWRPKDFTPAFTVTIWKTCDEQVGRPDGMAACHPAADACGAAAAAPARHARQGRLDTPERAVGDRGPAPALWPVDLAAWRQRGREPFGPAP